MNAPLTLVLLFMVGAAAPMPACMNEYDPNVGAAIERSQSVFDQLQKHTLAEPWETRRDRLRKSLAAGGDYRVKNDLAIALAHTGQAAEAVTLLEQIEAEKPGLYVTAANLGTAYELAGNNEKALEWIRQGIRLNPRAHQGTEWLHVRILEAKIALKSDPKWLESNSISGALNSVRQIEISARGNRGEALTADQVKAALIYQLHERLQFVHPPDPIVGALLLDLGVLIAWEPSGRRGASSVFALADTYLKDLPGQNPLKQTAASFAQAASIQGLMPPKNREKVALIVLGTMGFVVALLAITLRWISRTGRAMRVRG